MTASPARRFLHVANGTCTTDIIRAAGLPGALSIWADPLTEGPVPDGLTDEELIDVRAAVLGGPDQDSRTGAANALREWRRAIDAHESYDELVLWFEHDLFDQLALSQLLSWMPRRLPRETIVSLICIGSFPGRPRFMGLGQLRPEELASLFGTRVRVTEAQYALAAAAWTALRSPTPEALDRLRHADTSAMPFLAPALTRFLQEYPSAGDGLSRSERRLLRLAEPGPIVLMQAFPRMHDDEDAYYITDGSLAALADSLASSSPPLIDLARSDNGSHPLQATMTLTGAGREVLNGRRDRLAGGIDRWLGGVHLHRGSVLWRWDDRRQQITRA